MTEVPEWFVRTGCVCIGFVLGCAVIAVGYWRGRADATEDISRALDTKRMDEASERAQPVFRISPSGHWHRTNGPKGSA